MGVPNNRPAMARDSSSWSASSGMNSRQMQTRRTTNSVSRHVPFRSPKRSRSVQASAADKESRGRALWRGSGPARGPAGCLQLETKSISHGLNCPGQRDLDEGVGLLFPGLHKCNGRRRVIDIERPAHGDQLDQPGPAVVVANIESDGQAVATWAGADDRKSQHPHEVEQAAGFILAGDSWRDGNKAVEHGSREKDGGNLMPASAAVLATSTGSPSATTWERV